MARMSASDRRTLLVQAAIAVMTREGVTHTTTRAIVAEAGMQIGVFHYCFRSKDELVLEVMRTISARTYDAVEEALRSARGAGEIIPRCLTAYWQHVQRDPAQHQLTFELTHYALRQPGQEPAAVAQYEHYLRRMGAFLVAAADAGAFVWRTDVEALARFVLATLEGITFQWLVLRDDDAAQVSLDALVEHLLREAGVTVGAATPR